MRLALALSCHQLAWSQPLVTARGVLSQRTLWRVAVSGNGVRAIGEAAPLPGFGGEAPEQCHAALHACGTSIELDAHAEGDSLGDLEIALSRSPCARAALAGACAAWRAHRHGVSLAQWYHRDAASAVAVNGLGVHSDENVVKIKVGADPLQDAARLCALAALRPSTRWRADANGAWTCAQALAFLEACAAVDLDYLEQPLAVHDLKGWRDLRSATTATLAADEMVRSEADLAAVAELVDVVVLKPSWLGGWSPTRRAWLTAHGLGLRAMLSSGLESAVGLWHVVHIAAALDRTQHSHHGLDGRLWLGADAPRLVNGCIQLDAAQGLSSHDA